MNFSNITSSLFNFFNQLSQNYGTGDIVNDFVISILMIIVMLILLSIVGRLISGPSAQPSTGFERTGAALGRLEKMEMTLNTFKTESMRSSQMVAADLGFLKHELQELRKAITGQGSLDLTEHYAHTGGYEPAESTPEPELVDELGEQISADSLEQDNEKKN